MRPELFLYVLAAAMVVSGVVLSYLVDIPLVGMGFFIMGVLLFLLPSMRKPERRS